MLLAPARVKYRKHQRGRLKGSAKSGNFVFFGDYGLQALDSFYMTAMQIEACRLTLVRYVRKQGKMWIRVFPCKSISKKPAETRMGKGKGNPEFWVFPVKRGRILFELAGIDSSVVKESFRIVSHKLPVRSAIVERY